MSTVVINAYTNPFPTIINRIRADVSTQLSPLAIVASQVFDAPHPSRIMSFPGLPRTNYVFQLNEIDVSDIPIYQLAYFDIVPGDLTTGIFRGEEQIKVDITPGLVSGATSFTFDGSGGTPDWTGWEISPEEYDGVGTLIRGTDYSWDSVTGTFAYLQLGQVFMPNQWFTVEFEAQVGGAASVPTATDFGILLVTTDQTLDVGDMGLKLLVEPEDTYIELILPSIDTVPVGRYLMVETETTQDFKCVKFIPSGIDIINYLHGDLYMMMNEKLYLWKYDDGEGRVEWRVCNEYGNFLFCGQLVSDDLTNVFNKVLADGTPLDKFQYARLYNEVVLRLPVSQRVNYDSWTANQTLYSLANSADISNVDLFHTPNRAGLVEKANPVGRIVGTYEPDSIGPHSHNYLETHAESYTGGPTSSIAGGGANVPTDFAKVTGNTGTGITTETVMKNYSVNKFILV